MQNFSPVTLKVAETKETYGNGHDWSGGATAAHDWRRLATVDLRKSIFRDALSPVHPLNILKDYIA